MECMECTIQLYSGNAYLVYELTTSWLTGSSHVHVQDVGYENKVVTPMK